MADVVIIGGGPAGLSAALILGRMNRSVLVVDAGRPRNLNSAHVHGLPAAEGSSPSELRRSAVAELGAYPRVEVRTGTVESVTRDHDDGFGVRLTDGPSLRGGRILFATGLVNVYPELPGLAELAGRGVYSCVYCDGWELRDRKLAVLGNGLPAVRSALHLRQLTSDVTVYPYSDPTREALSLAAAAAQPVAGVSPVMVESTVDGVRLHTSDGGHRDFAGLFATPRPARGCALPESLGCASLDDGRITVNQFGMTSVPRVFAAGDVARLPAARYTTAMVVTAMASGAQAGVGLDQDMLFESQQRYRSTDE